MPVAAAGQLEDVLLVDRRHVVVVTLEPVLPLLPHPANVVAGVTGAALVCQHSLVEQQE